MSIMKIEYARTNLPLLGDHQQYNSQPLQAREAIHIVNTFRSGRLRFF